MRSLVAALEPVLVASAGDVTELVRRAHEDLSRLELELQEAEEHAELAELEAAGAEDETAFDVRAGDLIRASVEERIEARRLELAAEVERARDAAALTVDAARAEARDILDIDEQLFALIGRALPAARETEVPTSATPPPVLPPALVEPDLADPAPATAAAPVPSDDVLPRPAPRANPAWRVVSETLLPLAGVVLIVVLALLLLG